ncbi:sensor domain-containing diguanylate cyclase, partial [Planktothrix sp. FACHB-1355]
LLDQFQIKAQITVPLLEGNHLWGLLCVYQCSSPRSWTAVEIQFVQQLAAQFSVALKHSELLEQSCSQAEKLIQINHALEQANSKLEELSNIDTLTKIANRRCFDNYFAKEWQIHQEEQKPLAIIIIDIDYFKLYNDSYGHQEGDDCLMLVAQNIAKVTQRSIDLVARYGGEEFIAILPNTNTEGALTVAESMRKTIASLAIPHANSEVSQYLTLSLGIASLIPTAETYPENLIANADKALYVAKNQGRDRAMVYTV